jgi:hypothetical protein
VSRPGYGVSVAGPNSPPSSPGRASSQELAQANGQLTSHGGQSGGASQQPTDSQAQSYNVGTPNSPGSQIITNNTTSSQGRGSPWQAVQQTAVSTAQQGAQNTNTVGTATRVAIQNFIQAFTPVAPPVTPPPVTPPITPISPPVTPPPVTPPPVVPPPIVPPPIVPPPIVPPPVVVTPGATATYAMVTQGPFSTSTGASPVPYLTGAFAGSGDFMVSPTTGTPFPILGYQTGGLNADGTPNTTSRQFQAGLSVTGKGANQNATLFVMTSVITNAPNIGFTQGGGFMGVTMRNGAGWYGLANGAVASTTSPPALNSVPTQNGVPIASFTLNNTNTNLNTGTVSNTQSYNYLQSGPTNYKFNPLTTGTPTTLANNHPALS